MSASPTRQRVALAVPRLPLPAILGFAVAGCGGAAFLAFTSFSHVEAKHPIASGNGVPVYEARAVPFDSPREDPAERATSIARALTASRLAAQRIQTETAETERPANTARPTLLADAREGLRGFSRFSNFGGANNYLTITGANFGMSAQMSPTGLAAPDAETAVMSAVPEASTWLCGAALFVLVAARGVRAGWRRKRRR
jgi:hypothetical protein